MKKKENEMKVEENDFHSITKLPELKRLSNKFQQALLENVN